MSPQAKEEKNDVLVAVPTEISRKADAWDTLMDMCGSWQDGSQTTVSLIQDDATRTCLIKQEQGFGKPAKRFFTERGGFMSAIEDYRKSNDNT